MGGGGGGGVRKTIIVDLTSVRRPKWVARYEKWIGGGGGVAVSVRLKPYYQTSALDGAPTVLH